MAHHRRSAPLRAIDQRCLEKCRARPVTPQHTTRPSLLDSLSALLTPRRIRAHAVILALSLWGICAVDYATPGLFDRGGNIKFQDFLSFYISGNLIAQGRTSALYDESVRHAEMMKIAEP